MGAIILGEHFGVGHCLGDIFMGGGGCLGHFLFQVIYPRDTFTTFNVLINCSLLVLIYEYFERSSVIFDKWYFPFLLKVGHKRKQKTNYQCNDLLKRVFHLYFSHFLCKYHQRWVRKWKYVTNHSEANA